MKKKVSRFALILAIFLLAQPLEPIIGVTASNFSPIMGDDTEGIGDDRNAFVAILDPEGVCSISITNHEEE